jgi:CheY-like chemotaxis protein
MAASEEQGSLIVVVEDSEDLRRALELALRSEGYRAIGCEDADTGFDIVRRELPALVLTDIGLGVTSGLDLVTRVRSDIPASQQPVIIACSGFLSFKQEALARGADSFLPKPFDFSALLAALAEALAGKPQSAPVSARATQRARALRQDAIAAAKAARARWTGQRPDYEARSAWAIAWLPRYLGFGRAVLALIEDDELRVFASSDPRFVRGAGLDESSPFCRDVVETGSNLVLPDASLWGQSAETSRFFAGVPVTDGAVAIGVLALLDDQPHHFEGEDLALLEALARRSSVVLGAFAKDDSTFFARSGLISRSSLRMLLTLEIKRSEHTMSSLFLLVFEAGDASWRRDVEARLDGARTTVSELGGDRFAVSLVRVSVDDAVREVRDVIEAVRLRGALAGGGLVSLTGGNVAMRSGDELIWLAEELCARALRRGDGQIETVLVRHEPWPTEISAADSTSP